MRAYTDALLREMEAHADAAKDTAFDTVFFGGGTPSLLPIDCADAILKRARALFCITSDVEITMEANPATADEEKLSRLFALGVNRLSVGVQSLDDKELTALGRLHSGEEALSFLSSARNAGFENINVDLMYGIPYQTEESALKTLKGVLALAPTHISAYSLMLEEGTPLYQQRKSLPIPNEEEEEALDLCVKEVLASHGYRHYEISNYAKEGYASRHNMHYWHSDPYLGFGVAAYSYFDGVRYGNHSDLAAYIADPQGARASEECINESALAYEWLMLRLRLSEGVSVSEYRARFGVDLTVVHEALLKRLCAGGLMENDGARIRLTERGFRVSNSILLEFMPD